MSVLTGLADQTTTPLWVEIPQTLSYLITAIGLIITGCWAYVRFVRGRVLHAACEIDLSARKVDIFGHPQALNIRANIKNVGGVRLLFPVEIEQNLIVARADKALWEDAVEHGDLLWTEGICHKRDILKDEGGTKVRRSLEPGERFRRFALVPIASDPCAAYRISLRIEAQPKLVWRTLPAIPWEAELVLGEDDSHG